MMGTSMLKITTLALNRDVARMGTAGSHRMLPIPMLFISVPVMVTVVLSPAKAIGTGASSMVMPREGGKEWNTRDLGYLGNLEYYL